MTKTGFGTCSLAVHGIDDVEDFVKRVDSEICVSGELVAFFVGLEEDGYGAGGFCAEEVIEIIAYYEGLGRAGCELSAQLKDAKGIGFYGAILSVNDGVKGQIVFSGDGLGVGTLVAGQYADADILLAEGGEGLSRVVIEVGFCDCAVFMGCEYEFSVFSLAGCHLLHGFEDRAGVGGKAHLFANRIEIKERPGYRTIQIEYNGFYRHLFSITDGLIRKIKIKVQN
jgi:hypothetical protein